MTLNTKLIEFLENMKSLVLQIKKSSRICLIHHDDGDGCSSAALFSIIIYNITGDYPRLFPIRGANNVNRNLMNKLKTINPDFVFVLDVSLEPRKLNIFKGFILDHHLSLNIAGTENMPYLNPRFYEDDDEKVPPTSYMIYKILKDLFPEEKVAWISGVGITEDHRVELCHEIFETIKNENPEFITTTKIEQTDIENSIFGVFWDMVRSGRMVKKTEGSKAAVLALLECKNRPDKFLNGLTQNSFVLKQFYEKVMFETQNFLVDVKKTGKFYRDKKVIVYEARRVRISGLPSFICDKIRQIYPDWIVIVVGVEYGMETRKISIRLEQTKRNENLVDILEKIREKFPNIKGGGHKSAVGVFAGQNDLKKFFDEFLSLI